MFPRFPRVRSGAPSCNACFRISKKKRARLSEPESGTGKSWYEINIHRERCEARALPENLTPITSDGTLMRLLGNALFPSCDQLASGHLVFVFSDGLAACFARRKWELIEEPEFGQVNFICLRSLYCPFCR